jgi:hypothetical protein
MIRNKRTTFASCIDTDSSLTNRNTVPRLAGPIDDDDTPFHYPTETPECFCRRIALTNRNSSSAPQR